MLTSLLENKPTRKKPLGRPRCRWENNIRMAPKERRPENKWKDNIRMDLKEMGVNTRTWVDSTQDRDYWRALCKCGFEPPGSINHGIS